MVEAVVELDPIPGLVPTPPSLINSTLTFGISNTNLTFLPMADGGPYTARFAVVSQAPYGLWAYATFFPPPGPGDAGVIFLQDNVSFTTP